MALKNNLARHRANRDLSAEPTAARELWTGRLGNRTAMVDGVLKWTRNRMEQVFTCFFAPVGSNCSLFTAEYFFFNTIWIL